MARRPSLKRPTSPGAARREQERRTVDPRHLPGFDPERLAALGLSRREMAVLELVADGRTNEQVAAALDLSPLTVKKHLERMYERLDAPNRASLVAAVWRTSRPRGS